MEAITTNHHLLNMIITFSSDEAFDNFEQVDLLFHVVLTDKVKNGND